MNLFLTLFFVSFLGIFILLSRKIFILKRMNLQNVNLEEDLALNVPDLEEIKVFLGKNFKKYGYITLYITVKIYLLSRNTIKKYTVKTIRIIKSRINKNKEIETENTEKKTKEISAFLKMIKEYKDKIKRIKYKIKKETGLN